MKMNTSRKKIFFSVLSLSIMMSMLCILGCSCSKQIQWKSAENHQASLIDGLSIYIDHQTSKASANVLKIIVVNNSVEDIAICETDEAVLQKLNGSQWQVIDPGERQSTSALKTFILPISAATCIEVDPNSLFGKLTQGSYRVELCCYHLDDVGETLDKFYLQHQFEIE